MSRISPGFPVYCKPLGQQKKRKDSFPQAPGFFADGIFILVMYFGADNIPLTDKSVFTAYIGLSLLVSDINYFLPSKIFVSEYTAKIKIPSAQKPGTYWNQSLRFSFFFFFFFFFFLLPKTFAVNCRTRQNATRQLFQQFH